MCGGEIDVFKNATDGVRDAAQTIRITDYAKKAFTPQKAIMANSETQFVFLTPEKHGVSQFDIETEKVVSAWKAGKDGVDLTLTDIATRSKGAQLDSNSTFMSINNRQVMEWDMRTEKGATASLASPTVMARAARHHAPPRDPTSPLLCGAAPSLLHRCCRSRAAAVSPFLPPPTLPQKYSAGSAFTSDMKFTCAATTGDGHVAVANQKGEVRLFTDRTLTKAKTNFPGIGNPITHLDVSFDGHWVIATTDTYVAVLCTMARDDKGEIVTGYEKAIVKKLAAPRLLKARRRCPPNPSPP